MDEELAIQVLPRIEFVDVLGGFEEVASGLSAREHAKRWAELEAGSWLELGETLSLLELAECSRIWGRHLLPMPFVETNLLSRWFPGMRVAASDGQPLTFAVYRAHGGFVIPHAGSSNVVVSSASSAYVWSPYVPYQPGLTMMSVDLAPSLPLVWSASVEDGPGMFVDVGRQREYVALLAAEAVGAAEAALDATIAYTKVREQFGQPVARFQAVQHKLADMWRDVQFGHSGVVMATQESDKAFATASVIVGLARGVCDAAIQLHGGFGYTWDAGVHLYLRHVMAVQWIVNNVCSA